MVWLYYFKWPKNDNFSLTCRNILKFPISTQITQNKMRLNLYDDLFAFNQSICNKLSNLVFDGFDLTAFFF